MNRSSHDIRQARNIFSKENMTPTHRQSNSRNKRHESSSINSKVLSSRTNAFSPHRVDIVTTTSRHFQNSQGSEKGSFFCQNHKGKEAKYRIVSDDEDTLYYCQKCSIFLASQGFAVEKMLAKGSLQASEATLRPYTVGEGCLQLKSHVQHVLKNLEEKQQAIRKKIADAEHYKDEIQLNLDAYFKKILDYVNEKKRQFKKFVENEHRKLLQGYQEHEVQIQKAIIQTYEIKDQVSDKKLNASEKGYYKNCIMKSRIMCEKLDVMKAQNKKDIVTIDLSQIIRIIDENLKIKVKVADIETERDEEEPERVEAAELSRFESKMMTNRKKSIGESEIRRIGEHYNSLFSNDDS